MGVVWHSSLVERSKRWEATGGFGATVWFTGLSGSGKSTLATEVERLLVSGGRLAYLLDGDNLRHGLNSDLGFSAGDRDENVRRVSEVALLMADAGVVSLVPVISPHRKARERARKIHEDAGVAFLEIYVDTPLDVCEQRDPKGLYAKARAGELSGLTGVDAPYEVPEAPDLVVRSEGVAEAVFATASIAVPVVAPSSLPADVAKTIVKLMDSQ